MSDSPPRAASGFRGLAPLTSVLLLALLLGLAAAVSGAVLASDPVAVVHDERPPRAVLSLTVEAETLWFTHRAGDALDVADLRLVVTVDGDPLTHQPPVPFFSARGFRAGPTGPFNSATDSTWTAGETASVRIAGTNRPTLSGADVVSVAVYTDGELVTELSARPG